MYPTLFHIGPLVAHTYGFMIACGFILQAQVAKFLIAHYHYKITAHQYQELSFWALIVGMIGARFLYVITRWSYFMSEPAEILQFWNGGFVFFGGPLAVIPFLFLYCKKQGFPALQVYDLTIPCLVINHAFGRLGCFFAGCCYGKPTSIFLGVKFYSDFVDQKWHGVPLHPTQLYEAFSLLSLFGLLCWIQRSKRFHGELVATYLIVYPLIRIVVELFRGDEVRGFVIPGLLSTSQFISIIGFCAGLIFLITRLRSLSQKKLA